MIIQKKKRKKERKKNARTRACFFHQLPELKFVKNIGTACPSWVHVFLVKRNFALFLCTFHKLIPPKCIYAFLLQIRKRRKLRVSIKLLASKTMMAEISRSISRLPVSWARIFHTWCTFLQVHTAHFTVYSAHCTLHGAQCRSMCTAHTPTSVHCTLHSAQCTLHGAHTPASAHCTPLKCREITLLVSFSPSDDDFLFFAILNDAELCPTNEHEGYCFCELHPIQ